MFEFLNSFLFGKEILVNGQPYQSIRYLQNGHHLAVKLGEPLPALCYVVKADTKVLNNKTYPLAA